MSKSRFVLDNSVKHLKGLFPQGSAKTITECGLKEGADDIAVIDLCYKRDAMLVTTDLGIQQKCRQYQATKNDCLSGLLILPDGAEQQKRVLKDIQTGRKAFHHSHYKAKVSWLQLRHANLVINTRVPGQPSVQELCDCKWED